MHLELKVQGFNNPYLELWDNFLVDSLDVAVLLEVLQESAQHNVLLLNFSGQKNACDRHQIHVIREQGLLEKEPPEEGDSWVPFFEQKLLALAHFADIGYPFNNEVFIVLELLEVVMELLKRDQLGDLR